jgi:hypothetical protein
MSPGNTRTTCEQAMAYQIFIRSIAKSLARWPGTRLDFTGRAKEALIAAQHYHDVVFGEDFDREVVR